MSTDVEKQDEFVANEVQEKTELLESNEKCMGYLCPQVNLNSWNPENQKQWEVRQCVQNKVKIHSNIRLYQL